MKKSLLAILFTVAIIQQTSAMQPLATRTAGQIAKHYGRKGFSGLMTALHWTIAAGPHMASGAIQAKWILDEKKTCEKFTNVNEVITNFVKSELQKTNTPIDAVKINPAQDFLVMPMATLNKHIILSNATAKELTAALETNDENTLNKWRGSLQHESRHIYNNDLIWRPIAYLTMPFATHGLTKTIYNALPTAKNTRSFALKQLVKIPTGLGKLIITTCGVMGISRYQEQRADDEISDDIDALKGIRSVIDETEQKNIELMKPLNLSPKQDEWLRWSTNFIEPHPLPKKRIEKLDQRIASLEKQSEKKEEILS